MELEVAAGLIKAGIYDNSSPQTWADLGAGSGLFTRALALLLPLQSTIVAIDNNATALKSIELPDRDVKLITSVKDFVRERLDLPSMDGILMANALHFSPDKTALLNTLRSKLNPSGRIILVEYDTDSPNPWVPYPVSLKALPAIAGAAGFNTVRKIGDTPSVYNSGMIYSAVLS